MSQNTAETEETTNSENTQNKSLVLQGGGGVIPVEALRRGAARLKQATAFESKALVICREGKDEVDEFVVWMVNPSDHPNLLKVADDLDVPWTTLNLVKIEFEDFSNFFSIAYGLSKDLTELNGTSDTHTNWHDLVDFNRDEGSEPIIADTEHAPSLGEQKAKTPKEFVQQIMRTALVHGVSDIHIDMGPTTGMIRFRIDGLLYSKIHTKTGIADFSNIDNKNLLKLCGAIATSAGVNYEDALNQPKDGSLVLSYQNINHDKTRKNLKTRIRFASIPRKIETGDQRGVKVTLRINQKMITNIDELGLENEVKEIILKALQYIGGIGFIVGGTGSGKTNILASMHTNLRKGFQKNVMEFADTIEQMFEGMCQTEVDANCSEGDIIKSYLRHDPDVIVASEVRDKEATSKLVEIATAGKLVLSTLHANSLPGVFIRLEKLGIDRYTQSETLRFIVFTTLVRKLCPKCKIKGFQLRGFDSETYEYIASKKGCAYCRFVGYKGRTSIAEALCITPEISDMIADGVRGAEICKKAEECGWLFPLSESIGRKLVAGITSKAEVLRVIDIEKRHSQNKKEDKKPNYDYREHPSKNEWDAESKPRDAGSQSPQNNIKTADEADENENIIDLEEVSENDFAAFNLDDVDWNLNEEELAAAVINLDEGASVREADILSSTLERTGINRFETHREGNSNGKH